MNPKARTNTAPTRATPYLLRIFSPIVRWLNGYFVATGAANKLNCELAVKFEDQVPVAPFRGTDKLTVR
jgi:hypothetical protein